MVGPQYVVQFISDNGSNFVSAGNMLVQKYTTMYNTRCAARGIQLLLKDFYEQIPWMKSVVDDAKSIQAYMYRHTIVTALMRKATKGRELKKPCTTRFVSNFLVVQSVVTLENELRFLVASSEWRDLSYSKSREAIVVTGLIQNNVFWSQARECLQALEPLVRALRLVDGDGSAAGYLYQAMELAKVGLQKRSEKDRDKYGYMLTLFEVRRKDNITHPIHAFAASLDPLYMTSPDFKQTMEMKEGMFFLFEKVLKPDENDLFTKQYRDYILKPSSLFNATTYSLMKTCHPRIWWEFCGDSVPTLKKYAIRIPSQPCSSSSCERNWSAFEAAQIKKRNRLSPDMLGMLVYCRMNIMMMQKTDEKMFRDADPVDLSKLAEWPDYE
ncbi:unnamed protein product [Cuscuta europaea]|uniref:HAT C-terminal dimerisation domain-containing protein n=1 Tax=Cuscuta europaea TaxID=41803 RepID=A0A9P1EJY7_CUSEU|nr:unnamed protein product [Cuscuta europaea]CAH9111498.1 unnamed protein product [Cuscuta europaea]